RGRRPAARQVRMHPAVAEPDAAAQSALAEEALVEVLVKPVDVYGDVLEQPSGGRRVAAGRVDRLAAAVADQRPPPHGELVAPGMAAEVVVVVEDEDAGI